MKIGIYIDRRRKRENGKYSVYIRLQDGKRQTYINTSLDCQTDISDLTFSKKEPGHTAKTFRLRRIYTECEEYLYHNPQASFEKAKEALSLIVCGKTKTKHTVASVFAQFTRNKQKGTKAIYERTLRKILEFDPKADLNGIAREWLERFEQHLRNEGANTNGISIHMRNLRAVFNHALDEEITTNYPFRKYKIKQEQTAKRDLTPEQIRRIMKCRCAPHQKEYRDIFMLIFYLCGINIGDLLLLKHSNVNNGRIEYHRRKTNKYYSIKIEPEAKAILDKYKGQAHLLSHMDRYNDYHDYMRRMNKAIRKLGMTFHEGEKYTGNPICPTLSTYYARHSWASIAAEIDIPMDTIAQALGHSTPYSTTDIYVNRRLKKIDIANRQIIDFIKKD
jgi:integrase